MRTHIKPGLPPALRQALVEARRSHGWSQAELGTRVGLPQMHISAIETGRVVPRYDTLIELVRVLEYDLVLVPRQLAPVVRSLVRERGKGLEDEEQPLYTPDEEDGSS